MTLGNEGLSIFGNDRTGENILTGVWTPGKVFYVDTSANGGSDSNTGLSVDDPLLKINAAMDKCTANKGDVIQVLGNSPSSPNDTATITMDVAGVTLRGLYGRGMLSDSGFGSPTQDVPCLTIAANYVTVENLYLGVNSAGSTGGVIEFAASCYSFTLRNCLIETQYAATYGVYGNPTFDLPYLLIEDCRFGATDRTNFTNAINIANNASMNSQIRRNTFTGCSGPCISLAGSVGGLAILDNRFQLVSDTEGYAITTAVGSSNNFFDGNHAAFGDNTMSTNPYKEGATTDSNDWGLNYAGIVALMPA